MSTRPLVLLSNDDGYASPGIAAMRAALQSRADVVLVAPETEQSASSHSLSLHRPLRVRQVEPGVFAMDGTPADCVYVALYAVVQGSGKESRGIQLLPRRPDLVISGINRGLNLGQDAFYSGTVAAAREGSLRGIPSLATSAHQSADFTSAAELTSRVAFAMLEDAASKRAPLLNLNVPGDWKGEVRATRLGARIYEEFVDFRTDPRGRLYLWLGGPAVRHERDAGTDTDALDDGAASITSLVLDLTDPTDGGLSARVAAGVSR